MYLFIIFIKHVSTFKTIMSRSTFTVAVRPEQQFDMKHCKEARNEFKMIYLHTLYQKLFCKNTP